MRTRGRLTGRFLSERRANFATMTAWLFPAGIALAAIAIDAGSLYTERRELQSAADLAAIAGAASLSSAPLAVQASLADNGLPGARQTVPGKPRVPAVGETLATVRLGRYAPELGTAVGQRFVPGATPNNAVEVTVQTRGTLHFGSAIMEPPELAARGVARIQSLAAFSVGSRLVKLEGGIANALLGALLGGQVSLSAMDYDALAKADISLFGFLDALAVDQHLSAATYDEVLDTEVRVGAMASAMAQVPGLDQRARIALRALGLAADPKLKLPLGRMLDLGQAGYLSLGGKPSGMTVAANALQLITAGAAIANGKNQLALDLGATVPGLLSASLDLAIGEPPQYSGWLAVGEPGRTIRTAQTRLLLTVDIGSVAGGVVRLPLYVEIAFAEASLGDVTCQRGDPKTVKVAIRARPGVAELKIGDLPSGSLKDFTRPPAIRPARIVKTPLASVTAAADVQIAQIDPKTLTFTRDDIEKGTIKSAATTQAVQSLTKSLLDSADIRVQVVGIDLGVSGPLKATVVAALNAAAPSIDTLLNQVLSALGITIGEADIRVHGAVCGRPALVQ